MVWSRDLTANRDSRRYMKSCNLLNHIEELNQTEFASQFKDFLKIRYKERL